MPFSLFKNKKLTGSRTFRIAIFLFILVAFPLVFSSSQTKQNLEQHAQAPRNPVSQQGAYWIYGGDVLDTLKGGWGDHSYVGAPERVSYVNKAPVYKGTNSILFQSQAPYTDRLIFRPPNAFDLTQYQYLTFYARASITPQNYGVTLTDEKDNRISTQLHLNRYGGYPPPDKWQVYNIPIKDFGQNTNQVWGIEIADIMGSAQPPLFIDEISLSNSPSILINNGIGEGPSVTLVPSPTPEPDYIPQISPWVFIVPGVILFLILIFQ